MKSQYILLRRWLLDVALANMFYCIMHSIDCTAATNYASLSGGHVPPFTNGWNSAATNIQAAIDAATSGDTILVSNGTYTLRDQIYVTKTVIVRSVNGSSCTIINGGFPSTSNRCFYLNNANATIEGFTISNGYIWQVFEAGGGVFCDGGGTISKCVVCHNSAIIGGGISIYGSGTVIQSIVAFNNADNAGGIDLYRGGIARDTLVMLNTSGGGSGIGTYNGGIIENCTVAANGPDADMRTRGGSSIRNSIFYQPLGSVVPTCVIDDTDSVFCNNRLSVLPTGSHDIGGNISNDPQFVNSVAGNFTLNITSPCANAGTNMAWMTNAFDMAGNVRVGNGVVDMGCYELGGDVRVYGAFAWKQKSKTTIKGMAIMPLLRPYFETNYLVGVKDDVTGEVIDGPYSMKPSRSRKTWRFIDKVSKVQVTYTEHMAKSSARTSLKYSLPTIISTNSHVFLRTP